MLAEVPLDLEIREKSDAGVPLVISMPDSHQGEVYRTMADKVWQSLETKEGQAGAPVKIVIEEAC